jgi:hypothetical protein
MKHCCVRFAFGALCVALLWIASWQQAMAQGIGPPPDDGDIPSATVLTITPPTVTLAPGATQLFSAVPADEVTWTTTGGTITDGGLLTAVETPGMYTVTATRDEETATATVTIEVPPYASSRAIDDNGPVGEVLIGTNVSFASASLLGL